MEQKKQRVVSLLFQHAECNAPLFVKDTIMGTGFVKLDRGILEWEWYKDQNTKDLFFHCILKANHKAKRWQGIDIKRGEFLTGRKALSEELGMSEQQVRTSLDKLKSTNEITIKTTNRYSMLKVNNYERYQDSNQQATNKQPTDNQQITTTKKVKNIKNDKKIEKINKKKFGEFLNVLLSEEEYNKCLNNYLTLDNLDKAIDKLSGYIESSGKSYRSHYAVLGRGQWVYKDIMNAGPKKLTRDENTVRTIMGADLRA